jgi:hypothetical protein
MIQETMIIDGFHIIIGLAVVALVCMSIQWHSSRSGAVLEKWAAENGFQIIHSEYRHFMRGPFFWTTSKGQTVHYVTVRTGSGKVRTGWVRCGGFFLGLFSDQAEVRWED